MDRPLRTDVAVPSELRGLLENVFGLKAPPDTLGELADGFRYRPALTEDDLCCAEPSRHEVHIGETTRYTHCLLDAPILPVLVGESAEVRSMSPQGTQLTMRVTPEAIFPDRSGAVVSLGAAREAIGSLQTVCCPYINAFSSQEEY